MVDTVSSLTSAASTQSSSNSLVSNADDTLDKSAFLKLLVEQLKNQDPLQPQDDSTFVAQLAQFSGLEQQMQTNTTLSQIVTQLQGQNNAQLTSLVGANATIQGRIATLDANGDAVPITFMLNSASVATKASDSRFKRKRHT